MKTVQLQWSDNKSWDLSSLNTLKGKPHLVLAFWSALDDVVDVQFTALTKAYPDAVIIGCSTAGEILGTQVMDGQLIATAIRFAHSRVAGQMVRINDYPDSRAAGTRLAELLDHEGLVHVLVFSDGLEVNGSDLARGLTNGLPNTVTVTGGLAADSNKFQSTRVLWGEKAEPGIIAVVGLYGDKLKIGHGSKGGWNSFGPERLITSSQGNVLYEMDGESALSLYERYLGKHAAGLPSTGLLFPLSIREKDKKTRLVRTILSIDRKQQSLTFAGDVPVGAYAQLMKANFDRLVDGAITAAEHALEQRNQGKEMNQEPCDLAILISCVGRKLILGQMVEEEVEGVAEVLGPDTALVGFYSYGEIAPSAPGTPCELYNQTMTITTLGELV